MSKAIMSDGTEILIEALKAAVRSLDDAREATIALQQNLRAAEAREIALKEQLAVAQALCIELEFDRDRWIHKASHFHDAARHRREELLAEVPEPEGHEPSAEVAAS